MKTIGMIGGVSWESTAIYYRLTNTLTRERLGGAANARSLLLTLSFIEVAALQQAGDWTALTRLLQDAARRVEDAGADCLLLCSNTLHFAAEDVERVVGIPLLNVVDVTAQVILARGLRMVALLGTRYTMEQRFYRDRLRERHGIETLIPDEADRVEVHRVIFEELTQGRVLDSARAAYLAVLDRLAQKGAEGAILGCTEISMLLGQRDCSLPVFDTTYLHAEAAVEWALRG